MKNKNLKHLLPMQLQFFAEGEGNGNGNGDGGAENSGSGSEGGSKPTYEELVSQIAQANAEKEKMKLAMSKANSQAAEYKKQLTSKMTADEQAAAQQAELDASRDKEIEEMRTELATIKATKKFMASMEMDEKLATEAAGYFVANDTEKLFDLMAKHIKSIKDNSYQSFLSNRGQVHAGAGDADKYALSKEKAKAVADRNKSSNNDILKNYF